MSSSDDISPYTVLLLGGSQVGKSALVEAIKNYANPEYTVDHSRLGNGIVSKTDSIYISGLSSTLPKYEVFDKVNGNSINMDELKSQTFEDYQDALLSSPESVGIRRCALDVTAPPSPFNFRIVDTPGLCGTHDANKEAITKIVDEVVRIRSFNLILIVVSSARPLSPEEQLTFEYFAYILRGLHTKITFLYTRVEYADSHSGNTVHRNNMRDNDEMLIRIFRKQNREELLKEGVEARYSSMTIDLVSNDRPVVQCLLRNTILDILQKATGPSVELTQTTEKIRSFEYPEHFNQESIEAFRVDLFMKSRNSAIRSSLTASQRSILILGRTQHGKSTLIEHIRKYADPSYDIDASLLGNGNFSKTDITRPFFVKSDLPIHEAFMKDTGEVIDITGITTKWENEQDYCEVLFMREKKAGVRVVPQDPNTPSETVEFRFLDTPGLNNTDDRDSSHAANIISELIQTKSFNLIVIVFSSLQPVTQEHQLNLEYYADVLKGLHSRIMFLHTHVDYADIHHTNEPHHLNIKIKNKELSNIFRRQDPECTFDKESVEDYPYCTIDLVSKKRPVINCLIRNTIRTILKKATGPAVMLDTSPQNLDRISAIVHPSKYSEAEKKKVKQRFAEEASKLDREPEEASVDVAGENLKQINILLIGDVQSGKTSLVELFRLYADPDYVANMHHISQGSSRFADEKVRVTPFLSNLHSIEIRKMRGETGEYDVMDLDAEAKKGSKEDFEDLLNLGQRAVTTTIVSPSSERYRFNIYEGPSLNESSENFEKHIFSVHKTVVESDQEFHQVLFTLPPGPITNAIRTTIRVCSDIFSDLAPLFSFVHTKTDYPKLHHTNKHFHDAMKERQEILQRFISSKANPYLIDCNLQSNWPVQRAKTYNIVHKILETAVNVKEPIRCNPLSLTKTTRMQQLDISLKWHSLKVFQDTQKEIAKNKNNICEVQNKIRRLNHSEQTRMMVRAQKKDAAIDDAMKVMSFENSSFEVQDHCETQLNTTATYEKERDMPGVVAGNENMTDISLRLVEQREKLKELLSESQQLKQERRQHNLLRYCVFRETLPWSVVEAMRAANVFDESEPQLDTVQRIYQSSEAAFKNDPHFDLESNHDDEISILMFGKTQAGKSTMIEFMKKYADSDYIINNDRLGTGLLSTTGRPMRISLESDLVAFEVRNVATEPVDIHIIADQHHARNDYQDALKDRNVSLSSIQNGPDAPLERRLKFTFLDTPGIEDTDGKDTQHAPKIISEMVWTQNFNLIIVVVNFKDIVSKNYQLAFDYYSKVIQVLQGVHTNIVFVYTHVEYEKCYTTNEAYHHTIETIHKAFSRLFRGKGHKCGLGSFGREEILDEDVELYPKFIVDLDQKHLKRPILNCMVFNTLRDILQMAANNPPVLIDTIFDNLLRVFGITHPSEKNEMQKYFVLRAPHVILDQVEPQEETAKGSIVESCTDPHSVDNEAAGYESDYFNEDGIDFDVNNVPWYENDQSE